MPILIFRYGTMNSSKTANLLMSAHNYIATNKKIFVIKPSTDKRFDINIIKSRAFSKGMIVDLIMSEEIEDISHYINNEISCIFVDECQFLSCKNVDSLRNIKFDIPIICYGLRTDFKGKLFEGSRRLFEIADKIEEISTECVMCNRKAIINSKFIINGEGNREIIYDGNISVDLGGEEKYQSVCWNCWK
mgnify:CR=1 FL=1